MYKVFIDGVERHSVENSKACQFGNVKVYAGDPWHQAQPGVINDLTVKMKNPWSTVFERPARFPLSKKNLLTTLPNLTREWTVGFSLHPTRLSQPGWTNIFHMSRGENQANYGDRIPAVFFHRSSGLHIASGVNDLPNYHKDFHAPTLGEWTRIQISQELLNGKLRYRVFIDGEEKHNVENLRPSDFQNVKVFAADPWYEALSGFVKDMSIKIK